MRLAHQVALILIGILAVNLVCDAQSASSPSPTPESISEKAGAAMTAGNADIARKDVGSARTHYREAVELSRQLPGELYRLRAEALKKLAEVYDYEKHFSSGEALLKERLGILEQHPASAGIEVGLALCDLVTHYGMTQEVDKAVDAARRGVIFYKRCISTGKNTDLCNRRLADVEGMVGAILFKANRFSESEPWFESVVSRADESVRPQIMLASLRGYAKVLRDKGESERASRLEERANAFERNHPGVFGDN